MFATSDARCTDCNTPLTHEEAEVGARCRHCIRAGRAEPKTREQIMERATWLKGFAEGTGCTGESGHPSYALWAQADKALANANRAYLDDAAIYLYNAEYEYKGLKARRTS